MDLYLLRHGVAVEPEVTQSMRDADRPLTEKGLRRSEATGKALRKLEIEFDLILTSPYVRARQTAEIVAEALEAKDRLESCEALIIGSNPRKLIAEIHRRKPEPKSLLLVGHEPSMSRLISLLVWGEVGPGIEFKKGALCKLSVDSLQAGRCATLEWLMTARQMAAMV